jgi:hypothetical protein
MVPMKGKHSKVMRDVLAAFQMIVFRAALIKAIWSLSPARVPQSSYKLDWRVSVLQMGEWRSTSGVEKVPCWRYVCTSSSDSNGLASPSALPEPLGEELIVDLLPYEIAIIRNCDKRFGGGCGQNEEEEMIVNFHFMHTSSGLVYREVVVFRKIRAVGATA